MEAYCNEIISEIMTAKSEVEIIKVLAKSMSHLRKVRNSFNESAYVMNMIVSLRAAEQNELSNQALNNSALAIAIFRQIQKESKERIC